MAKRKPATDDITAMPEWRQAEERAWAEWEAAARAVLGAGFAKVPVGPDRGKRDRVLAVMTARHLKVAEKKMRQEYARWKGQLVHGFTPDEKAFETEGTIYDG